MATERDDGRTRLDKWLWAARFFKTRSLAAEAVNGGHVQVNGQRAKPGRALQVGERLTIHKGTLRFAVTVTGLASQRGPAKVAQTLYLESPESVARRQEQAQRRRTLAATIQPLAGGRPTKRERRRLEHNRG